MHPLISSAPNAPDRVWASICAGMAPSEDPAYTRPSGRPLAAARPRPSTVSNPISRAYPIPSSRVVKVLPS